MFSYEFCEICKNMFSTEPAAEHLQTTASAPSSSLSLLLLLIYPMFVFVQIQKASKNFNLVSHFYEVTSIVFIFFFRFFSVFLSFFHFFLSLLIKIIFLSWEMIKMFLPPLTSLKYVHVSK